MNALDLTLIRIGFLAVLWLFVIAAVGVVRTDLFGSAASARRRSAAARRRPARQPRRQASQKSRPGRPAGGRAQHLLVTAGALAGTSAGPDRSADHHRPGR